MVTVISRRLAGAVACSVLALATVLQFGGTARAQTHLNEPFSNATFPPTGWARFETGTGTVQQWNRIATAPVFAQSLFENVASGLAVDWLVTPAVTLAPPGTALLRFKGWQSFASNFGSVYRILVSTTSQTDPVAFTQVAEWAENTPCPGAAVQMPTAAPAARNCTLDLAAFAGQTVFIAFQHQNDDGDNFNLDDVLVGDLPPPALSLTPASILFPSGGPCTGVGWQSSLTASNSGGSGIVSLTSASVSGSAAFAIPAPPAFPVNLGPGVGQVLTMTFVPTAGMTGPQTGTLALGYTIDAGPPQSVDVPLYGSSDAEGAGFAFRSVAATPECTNGVPLPSGDFVDVSSHTRITAWTVPGGTPGDDSYLRFDLTTVPDFTSGFRLFGADRTSISITSNALVTFDLNVPTFYGGLAASGDATVQVGTMDLNTNATTYATDNTGVAGLPGVFYGTSDVDGDGDMELVITWWHVYDFGSTAWPNAAARFFTSQLIVYKADAPNEEDHFEMRFPSGNDANGVPFRNSTTVGGSPVIEADVAIGIGEPLGLEAPRYRNGNNSGLAMYPGGVSNGVRFMPEAQEMADGEAGWRMLGVPVQNYTLGRLARVNLVQGVTGQYPAAAANVCVGYTGTSWGCAGDVADVLQPGRGVLWYLYDFDLNPGDPSGTSLSYELPMALQGTGAEPTLANGVHTVPLHAAGDGWNFLANPFRDDLVVANMATWAAGGTLASAVAQMWEPDASTYVLSSGQGDAVSTWQGFMIENNTAGGATTLRIPPTPRTTGIVVVGREMPPRLMAFELAGTRADDGAATLDRAAMLYFGEDAEDGWDLRDAGKLSPLTDRYATLAFLGERGGETVIKAQESRPLDITRFEVPLAVSAVGTASSLTVSWPTLEDLPEEWAFNLRDLVTGTEIDLRTQDSYTFEAEPMQPRATAGGMPVLGAAEASVADARFLLVVTSTVTGGEADGLPTVFALHAPAPNPVTGPSAIVRFDLPEASDAIVELFDMLGRRVAMLAEGDRAAGRHAARLDAGALSSGVYVIRMRAGDFVQARRVTISR